MNLTFKRFFILSILTFLLGVSIVYALNWGLKPKNQVQAGPMAEGIDEQLGLKIVATLDKTEYHVGEPINISLTITNISNQSITYDICHLSNRFDFRVYNSTHDDIYQWSRMGWFPQAVDPITLGPGESLSAGQIGGDTWHVASGYYVWEQTCNNYTYVPCSSWPTDNGLPDDGVPVSPGTYYIVGQTGPIGGVNGDWLSGIKVVETLPIEITLIAP